MGDVSSTKQAEPQTSVQDPSAGHATPGGGQHQPTTTTKFTQQGAIPPVATQSSIGGPSASDQAFGPVDLATVASECNQEKADLIAKVGTTVQTLKAAIDHRKSADVKIAADGAATALGRADERVGFSLQAITSASEDDKKKPEYASAKTAHAALDKELNARHKAIVAAMEVPGATFVYDDSVSFADEVRGLGGRVVTEIDAVNKLIATSQATSKVHGHGRLVAADEVRQQLLAISAAERAYVMKGMKEGGVGQDIIDYYQGNGAALRKEGGGLDVGSGGNASTEANAQGGFSHATTMPNLGGNSALKTGTGDLSTGQAGAGLGGETDKGKTYGGGASVDGRADDGTYRFEGFKGDASFGEKGKTNNKVSGGFTQTTSPPTFDGVHWTLAWTVTGTLGYGHTNTTDKTDVPGQTLNADTKVSGSLVKSGVKAFDTREAAQAAYDMGAFELVINPTQIMTIPDATAAAQLKDGESITIGHSGDFGVGASTSASNVSVGVAGTVGHGEDVKIAKADGTKIRVTIRDISQTGASGSVGTTGVTLGAGGGEAKALSTTCEFDLGTAEGKAAYAEWLKSPHTAPKDGNGVKILSTGVGDFTSTNIGLGLGVGPINGSGTNASTVGEFSETTADKKSKQNTVVGSMVDTTKGFNPLTPDKESRSDSLEITTTTTDGKPAPSSYVIKTSIGASTDTQWANTQLNSMMGEANSTGALADKQTTGKWNVEGSYSQDQIHKFEEDVKSGKIDVTTQHANEVGNPGAKLKAVLANPNATEHDKQVALATWFSQRGPEASSDLRAVLGPPQMNVTLDNDKYLTGNTGQAAFEGKRQTLEDRLLDPELKGEKVKALLADVQALYCEQLEKRDHIANPANYPELPNGLRHELVKQVEANYAKLRQLRERVAARTSEEGLGDASGPDWIKKKMAKVNRARANATENRSFAVDARAKQNGALSAGHGVTPRAQLDSNDVQRANPLSTDADKKFHQLYLHSDAAWASGIEHMTKAEEIERAMFKETMLDPASEIAAANAADKAGTEYLEASERFIQVRTDLLQVQQMSKKQVDWSGADRQYYGTLD